MVYAEVRTKCRDARRGEIAEPAFVGVSDEATNVRGYPECDLGLTRIGFLEYS